MNMNVVMFNAKLPFEIYSDGKWFIACCPALDVRTQGRTEEKARKNLIEALSLFFISCYERGMLDSALKECGFKPASAKRRASKKPDTRKFIEVPIPLESTFSPAGCPA